MNLIEVIKITDKNIACLSIDEIKNLFPKTTDTKITKRKYQNIVEILSCFFEESQARIVFSINMLKISTPHEIKTLLGITSRDPVANHLIKAHNCGLVDVISKKHYKYESLMKAWKELHINTNKQPVIYIATEKLNEILKLFLVQKEEIFSFEQITLMESRGRKFEKIYGDILNKNKRRDSKIEKDAMEIVGSCNKCDKAIKKSMIENGLTETFSGNLYCKSCVKDMKKTGEYSKLLKNN